MISDIYQALGYLCGAAGIAAAVSFGLYGGFMAGSWVFGALNINVRRGDMNVVVRSDDAASSRQPEEKK